MNSNPYGDDIYTVEFIEMVKFDVVVILTHVGIYDDQLQPLFTAETGLHTHL